MMKFDIPALSFRDLQAGFKLADESVRRRAHTILHQQGDYHNRVINFVLHDSYMQPHCHPGPEKVEKMHLIKGEFLLLYFDECGQITGADRLCEGERQYIEVPAFTWHTYVMTSDQVVIYETMNGIYKPETWKKMAPWAPKEGCDHAFDYLNRLKESALDINKTRVASSLS